MSWLYTIFVAGLLLSNGGSDLSLPASYSMTDVAVIETVGDVIEKFDQTYPLNARGRVSLSNINGPIVIEAWDRKDVRMEVTKIGDSKESLDLIEIGISANPDHLQIESDFKSRNSHDPGAQYRNRKIEVHFRLQVPRTAVLNEIEAVNGSVTVSNFTNVTKVSAVNGTVIAYNLRGTAVLSTVNGELRANFDSLDPGSSINLETVNGRVNLEVPSDIDATIKADSLNGSIGNDFGLPVRKGKYVGRDLRGRIGTGAVPLNLSSVNGSLLISRKKDGKSPSSVTNLLNTTTTDDDEDEDSDEVSKSAEIKKKEDVATAANRSVIAAERSVKANQKSVEKTQSQGEKVKTEALADVKIKLDKSEFKDVVSKGMKQAGVIAEFGDSMWSARPISVEQRSASFPVKALPKVNVDASMCAVRVRGWDQPSVKYVLTEERSVRDSVLRINESVTENSVNIKVTNGVRSPRTELWGIENRFRIEIYVPRKADVTVKTEKEIRVESVSGRIELTGDNGPIGVRDSEGTLKLNTGDGLIRIVGFSGDLDLKTTDSDVYLEGDFTKISACAADANITLTMPSAQNASISTNTAIQSEGLNIVRDGERSWRLGSGGPKYEFEFAEGQLVVRNQARIDAN